MELPRWPTTSVVSVTAPPEVSATTTSTDEVRLAAGARRHGPVSCWVPGAVPSGTLTSSSSAGDTLVPVVVTLPTMRPPPLSVVV